ncbi:MAG: hypothetical protein K2Y22_14305 [Candidatus Obscuribacterales bacterium]|nr:hypothetical protein [Candidatus Obscuribacterales bacterium]
MSEESRIKLPNFLDALMSDTVFRPEVLELLLARLEDNGDSDTAGALLQIQLDNSEALEYIATRHYNELHGLKALAGRQVIEAEVALKYAQTNYARAKVQQQQGQVGVEAFARKQLAEAESKYAQAKDYETEVLNKESQVIATKRSEPIRQAYLRSQLAKLQTKQEVQCT